MARSYDIAILSQKVEYLESAGIELPKVTSSDNGKVLQVVSGKWKKGSKMPDEVSANPEGEITDYISGIQIGSDKFNIKEKSEVIEVVADGTKSISALMDELFALVDFDKIRNTSSFRLDKSYYHIYTVEADTSISFSHSEATSTSMGIRTFTIKASGSTYYFVTRSNDGTVPAPTNSSALILNSGIELAIHY